MYSIFAHTQSSSQILINNHRECLDDYSIMFLESPYIYFSQFLIQCDADNCQVRRVFCGSTDPREPWEFDESLCTPEHRPHSVRDCGGGECSRGEWTTSVYSAVSDIMYTYCWSPGLQPIRAPGSSHMTVTLNNVLHT